jgi:hypothetical protein
VTEAQVMIDSMMVTAPRKASTFGFDLGIGDTKVRAKIVTEFGEPGGIYRLRMSN